MYVSVATANHYPSIERFRLVKGVPEKNPDRVYQGYGGLLAVAGDGTLYAAISSNSSEIVVNVFPPNATKPKRTIIVPNLAPRCKTGSGGATATQAVAADSKGYLFLGIYTYAAGLARPPQSGKREPDSAWPCEGVAVYAPNAKGIARPVQVIRYPKGSSLIGLAVDATDNLYVANYPFTVDEYTNAITDPTRTRVFRSIYIGNVHAIATDAAGDVFIAGTDVSYKSGRIDRYAPSANGHGAPTSVISLLSGVHLLPSIAAHGRVIYIDDTYHSVDLYHSLENGTQSPFYSLPAPNVSSVAIGP